MDNRKKFSSIGWIIWTSRKAIFFNIQMKIVLFAYLITILCSFFGIKFDVEAINFQSFIAVSITGLSFTLALLVAVRNIFSVSELKTLVDYQVTSTTSHVFTDLVAPFIWSSVLWLTLGIISTLLSFIRVDVSNTQVAYFGTISFTMLICVAILSLFNIIADTIRDWVNHSFLDKSDN